MIGQSPWTDYRVNLPRYVSPRLIFIASPNRDEAMSRRSYFVSHVNPSPALLRG